MTQKASQHFLVGQPNEAIPFTGHLEGLLETIKLFVGPVGV